MKQMLKSQLKNVPKEQQEKLFNAIDKNPDLFKQIAEETQAKIKGGMGQMDAAMEVMKKHQAELQKAMQ